MNVKITTSVNENLPLKVNGSINFDQDFDKENLKEIKYDEAFLTVGITDMKGIQDKIVLKWGEEEIKAKPGSNIPSIIQSGITFNLPNIEDSAKTLTDFSFSINLQGSSNISFVPMGTNTEVNLKSAWTAPSFNGKFMKINSKRPTLHNDLSVKMKFIGIFFEGNFF